MAEPRPSPQDEHDRRLGEAIDLYVEQLRQGAAVSVDDWVGRYPELGDALRECLAALPLLSNTSRTVVVSDDDLWSAGGLHDVPKLPEYTLLEEIGRGGMGVVYKAVQPATKRIVAVKFLASGPYASPAARRRFAREIELAAALDHPAIVHVLEAGEADGRLYCVMEYVPGRPLHRFVSDQPLSVNDKLRLFLQIVEGVEFAHLRGVIHRDLKPGNILVVEGTEGPRDQGTKGGSAATSIPRSLGPSVPQPKIVDFGLARTAAGNEAAAQENRSRDTAAPDTRVTEAGQLLGTLPYISPEQASGALHAVDARSDLYALGVILYEMLTGRLPYDASGPLPDALHNICHIIPHRPSQFARGITRDLDAVVLKLLEKSAEQRYRSAATLAEDVRACLRGEPVEANRATRFYFLRKAYARHRNPVRIAAAGLTLVLIASIVILAFYLQVRTLYFEVRSLYFEVRQERDKLTEQLHISVLQHGLAYLAAGQDSLAELVLRDAYHQRPDSRRAYWSLLSFYVQNPLLAEAGRGGWTTALDYSRDGRWLASGNLTGEIALRDGRTLAPLKSTRVEGGAVPCVCFVGSADLLATAGADGKIRFWRTLTLELLCELSGHMGGVTHLRNAEPLGGLLSAGGDGRVLLWPLEAAAPPRVLYADAESSSVTACDLSPTGAWLAVATADHSLVLSNLRDGRRVAEFSGLLPPVEAVRFSPDERLLATWSRGELCVWDAASAARLWRADTGISEPRPTSLWDRSPGPHACWTPALEFSDDSRLLAVSGWDAVVRLWRPSDGEPRGTLRAHGTAVYGLAFQPGAHGLATAYIGQLRIWDLDHHPELLSRRVADGLERTCVAVSSRGGFVAWGDAADDSSGVVRVLTTGRPESLTSWRVADAPPDALAVDGPGERIAVAERDGAIAVWDVATQTCIQRWTTDAGRSRALCFAADPPRLVCGRDNGVMEIYDCQRGVLEKSWNAHAGAVLAVSSSPDGRRLASGGADWYARIWNIAADMAASARPSGEWRAGEWVNAVAFSPAGRQLAMGSADLTIRIGAPDGPPSVKIKMPHAHWINAVGFVDGGRVLVSGGNDAAIRFWDVAGEHELATLPSLGGAVQTLVVSEDERLLVVGAAHAVQIIDLGAAAAFVRGDATIARH